MTFSFVEVLAGHGVTFLIYLKRTSSRLWVEIGGGLHHPPVKSESTTLSLHCGEAAKPLRANISLVAYYCPQGEAGDQGGSGRGSGLDSLH